MSREIDERVVSMKFENQQFEQGIKQSERSVTTFNNTLNNMGTRGAALSSIANSVDTISSRFSALGIIGVTALQNITNKAIDAGAQLLKAFTIQPVSQGFNEYELKMNSVQTIMASTGASLQEVNGYLDELNTYADRTIYSFSDMTNNIGKFTNAGVSLDKAVLAIKGISNEAAVSGANATQASHAMYNFAQALSAGYVKLIDWKSIENAQMATVEFKNELINTAVSMGNLEKQADGTYKVLTKNGNGAAMKETISATKNFNDSLAYQWMTTDVLIETLGRYADETTEIGKKAYASAQDIKTFSMMIDTLKEATGSGWAQTFEILFGNFEESKQLWTSLGTVIGDFINKQADARNTMLKSWKTLGGRDDILAGLKWSFRGLGHIVSSISEAFENTFGRLRLYSLVKLSEGFKNLGLSFNVGVLKNLGSIKDIFTGAFSGLHIFTQAITAAFKALLSAGKYLAPVGKSILDFVASIGRGITALDQFITKNQVFERLFSDFGSLIRPIGEVLSTAFTGFLNVIQSIGSVGVSALSGFTSALGEIGDAGGRLSGIFSGLGNIIGKALNGLVTVFSKVGQAIGGFLKGVLGDLSIMDGLVAVLLTGSATKFVSFIKSLKSTTDEAKSLFEVIKGIFKGFGDIPNKIGEVLGSAKDAIKSFTMDLNAKALMRIAGAIAILAGALTLISKLDVPSLTKGLAGIGVIMTEMLGFMAAFSKIGSLKGFVKISASLIALGVALVIISGAMKVLSTMSWEGIAKGLVGTAGALVAIAGAMQLMPSGAKMLTIGPSMIAVAGAILILSGALKAMGSMSMDSIGRSLLVLGGALGEFALGLRAMNGTLGGSAALVVAAAALMLLAPALKLLGTMDNNAIVQSLVALAGALMVLSVAAKAMEGSVGSMIGVAASLGVLGAALLILAPALKILGTLSWEALAKGLVTIAGAFLVLGLAGSVLGSVIPQMILVSVALGVLGAALLIFTPALAALGSLKTETIVKGLVALAATFGVLGLAGLLLGPVTPILLALSVAIGVFGAAVLAVGTGVALFGAGLTALAAITAPAVENITNALKSVIKTIPEFAKALAEGFVKALKVLADNAPQVVKSLMTMLLEFLTQLSTLVPQIAEIGLQMIVALLTAIRDHLPEVVDLGMEIITGFLRGIADHIEELVDAGLDIITGIIRGIGENIQEIVTEAGHVVAEFIRGLGNSANDILDAGADFIRKLGQGIRENISAIGDFAGDIIGGFIDAVSNAGDRIRTAGKDAIIKFINGLGDCAIEIANAATDVIVKFCEALSKNAGLIMWAVSNVFKQIKSAFATEFPMLADFLGIKAEEVSWEFPERYAQGVYERTPVATGAVDDAGNSIASKIQGLKDRFGVPSEEAGETVPEGVGDGVSSNTGTATSAVESMGSSVESEITSQGPVYESAGRTAGENAPTGTASGIESNTSLATTAASNLGTAVASRLDTLGDQIGSAAERAGNHACTGMAAGINGLMSVAIGAANRLASAVSSTLNSALQINSPSKVTMKIGNGVVEGFALGITKLIPMAEKSSENLSRRTIDAAKKYLKINSPSKVARDEVGNYIVEGIAEGIDANTSAEDAAAKKAQNIINAFKTEIDKADLGDSINKLEYEIWEALNPDATEDEKNKKALDLTMKDLASQTERVNLLLGRVRITKQEFGENSEEYREAYNDLLKEVKTYAESIGNLKTLSKSITQSEQDLNKAMVLWQLEHQDIMVIMKEKLKLSEDEIRNYIRDQVGGSNDNSYAAAVRTALSDYEQFVTTMNEALKTGNLALMDQFKAGDHYAKLLAESVAEGGQEIAEASEKVGDDTVVSITDKSEDMKNAGVELMDELADGIREQGAAAVAAAKEVAAAIVKATVSTGISSAPVAALSGSPSNIVPVRSSGSAFTSGEMGASAAAKAAVNAAVRASQTAKHDKIKSGGTSSEGAINNTVNYNLTQNNSSPKALSNADIYRRTKTLLSTTKVVSSKGAAVTA